MIASFVRLVTAPVLLGAALSAGAAETFDLPAVMQLALQYNPGIVVADAQRAAAQAARQTALAYPNPDFETFSGPANPRQTGGSTGQNTGVFLSQPIDYPHLRALRARGADAGIAGAQAAAQSIRINLLAQVKSAFYEILRRQDELQVTREDVTFLQAIHDRVRLRVEVGEAARYELIKADAELLNAIRNQQSAELRLGAAKAGLARLVGPGLPPGFDVAGRLAPAVELPPLDALQEEMLARNPELVAFETARAQAQARLQLERGLRTPQVTVRAGVEQDPDLRSWRFGVALPLPLWNRREGPINEAAAGVRQADARFEQRRLLLLNELDIAYGRYLVTNRQLSAFEGGLLRQAEAALKVAEAAYRFGERGILDYLDAQRTFRAVRLDFLSARYELQNSLIEIERLRAADL